MPLGATAPRDLCRAADNAPRPFSPTALPLASCEKAMLLDTLSSEGFSIQASAT